MNSSLAKIISPCLYSQFTYLPVFQEMLVFYNDDDSYQTVLAEKNLCCSDLCALLAVKNRVAKDVNWTIVEHWIDAGIGKSTAKLSVNTFLECLSIIKVVIQLLKQLNDISSYYRKSSERLASYIKNEALLY